MNERATLEIIAPNVEEAITQGLADLNLPREAVEVEILDSGSRGLFGLGSRQVRIRLIVKELLESKPVAGLPFAGTGPIREDELLHLARQTVNELLEKMNVSARIEASFAEPNEDGQHPILINLHGDDLGILIGRRAEILNAFQYIVNLIVGKQAGHWVQIIIDVEGYRVRRERQLRQMARRIADQAVRTCRRQVLEPMPANERRIIHLELQNHSAVLTESIGEEPNRKVTICPR